ncbi:MAG: ABC transporter permease subunit [Syntrophomonadaceae bacterium]
MTTSIIREINSRRYHILGILIILSGWQVLAWASHPLIVASPGSTFRSIFAMLASGELTRNLLITLQRQLTGLAFGVLIGTFLGIFGGLKKPLDSMMMPGVNAVMATPSIIFVVIAMVWFGQGSTQVIFVTALLIMPIMYLNSAKGIQSIDSNLLQMVRVYRVPARVKLLKVYLPGLLYGFMAGFSLSVASSLRITIMAELLGAQDGIGNAIFIARGYLETSKLFAWALLLVLMVMIIEAIVFNPLQRFIGKWQE